MTHLIFMSDYFGVTLDYLVTAVLFGIVMALCYGGGYVIGRTLSHLLH